MGQVYEAHRAEFEAAGLQLVTGALDLDTFLSDSEERIDQLHNAQEARDLTLVAHSFKGSSSNMGATRLALLCGQLEERAQKKQLADIKELVIEINDEYQMVRRLYRAERQRVSVSSYLSGN